jgi:hypothetical protein
VSLLPLAEAPARPLGIVIGGWEVGVAHREA